MKNAAMFVALLTLTTIASAEEIGDEVARHYPAALSTFSQEFHLKERRQQALSRSRAARSAMSSPLMAMMLLAPSC